MRHQLVSCDCCEREVRDPVGWFALRYFHGFELDVPMVQIEEVTRWKDETNPDMEREYLCSPTCVCKRLRLVLKHKQKARLKALTGVAAKPVVTVAKQIEAPKRRQPRGLLQ